MASFVERIGKREARTIFQTEDLDQDTRVELWNVTHTLKTEIDNERRVDGAMSEKVVAAIWMWEFKRPADEQPRYSDLVWDEVKQRILTAEWFDVIDLIERVVHYVDRYEEPWTTSLAKVIAKAYNSRFEQYLVGYRFIDLTIAPLDTSIQSEAIYGAIKAAHDVHGAHHHLSRAVELLADRNDPDFPNSIKESISAVEAVCISITGQKTLGAALKKLKESGITIHPALESAWLKIYGWTSDEHGVRHGSIDAPNADQALAKYMLVTCSAFISLLIEVDRKSKLD